MILLLLFYLFLVSSPTILFLTYFYVLRLDRDKLVFNICSNKASTFDRLTLDLFYETCRAAYTGQKCSDDLLATSSNPEYWQQLLLKFSAIHTEIQDASRSINKSFGKRYPLSVSVVFARLCGLQSDTIFAYHRNF